MGNRIECFDKFIKGKITMNAVAEKNGVKSLIGYSYSDKDFVVNADTIDVLFEEYISNSENILMQFIYTHPEWGNITIHIQDRNILHWATETDKDGITHITIKFAPNDFEKDNMLEIMHNNNLPGSIFYFSDTDSSEYIDFGEISKECIISFKFPNNSKFELGEWPISFPSSDNNPENSQSGYFAGITIVKPFKSKIINNEDITIRIGIAGPKYLFKTEDKSNSKEYLIEDDDLSDVEVCTDEDLTFTENPPKDKDSKEFKDFLIKYQAFQMKNYKWKSILSSENEYIKFLLQNYISIIIPKDELKKDPTKSIKYQIHINEFENWIKNNKGNEGFNKYDKIITSDVMQALTKDNLSMIPKINEILVEKDVRNEIDKLSKDNIKYKDYILSIYNKYGYACDNNGNININKSDIELKDKLTKIKEEIEFSEEGKSIQKNMENLTKLIISKCGYKFDSDEELKKTELYSSVFLSIPIIIKNYDNEKHINEVNV